VLTGAHPKDFIMGLSETILAAMIGAVATVTTALFQIFTAFKNRGKTDVKPKRGSTMRSVLAVMALMIASAAGGFLYSELLRQRGTEDIRAMRQELRELRDLTAANVRERGRQEISVHDQADLPAPAGAPTHESAILPASLESLASKSLVSTAESIVYVPACRSQRGDSGADCAEADAQRVALCGTVPADARVSQIQLFAQPDAVQQPWSQHATTVEQDVGGARFTGKTFEYVQGADLKAVCVNFAHWSGQHPHIARIVVQYDFSSPTDIVTSPVADGEPTAVTPAVITSNTPPASSQTTAFTGSAGVH
jgi:hypothetical protein